MKKGMSMQSSVIVERDQVGAMPFLIARPRGDGSFPAIVALHGYTGNKETMLPLIEPLAEAGYIVAAPDARYHGERFDARWARFAQNNESIAMSQEFFATAGDIPALVDNLLARRYARSVTGRGVGILGVSMGALTTYAAVPLEARFSVAATLIGGGTWGDHFDEQFAHLSAEARANLRERDVLNHLDAFAPLAFLMCAGELDPVLPAWTTQRLYDALMPRVSDPARLRLVIEPGVDHTVTPMMGMETIEWFRRWLR
jgi:dienelactone hydrolase